MRRRQLLRALPVGAGLAAGCAGKRGGGRPDRGTYYVGPDGSDASAGSRESPLASIQTALERVKPGDTVHVLPGRYHEWVKTVRAGTPDAPITITGPPEAVFVGGDETDKPNPLMIHHSHVHVTGLTFDGLQNPDAPKDPGSYARGLIEVRPKEVYEASQSGERTWEKGSPPYLEDVKVLPHAVGNAQRSLVNFKLTNHVEVGGFEVIGPAGILDLYGGRQTHNGEIIYVGVPFPNLPNFHLSVMDQSHDYRVHHVDNSAGHPHAELVDVKADCYDVTVEYCTDAGGAASYTLPKHPETSEDAINLGGRDCTIRWNVIEGSQGQGVGVGNSLLARPKKRKKWEKSHGFELPPGVESVGTNNAIYGNRLVDCGGLAVQYPTVDGEIADGYGPAAQRVVCGNEYTGETHGNPGTACPGDVPATGTIGHEGRGGG